MNGINLIPAPHRAALAGRRRLRAWTAASVIWAACLGLAALATAGLARTGLPEARAAVAEQATVHDRLEQELARWRTRAADEARQLSASRAVGEHPDWAAFLNLLAQLTGPSIAIESCVIRRVAPDAVAAPTVPAAPPDARPQPARRPAPIERFAIKLDGLAPSPSAVTGLALRLEQTALFTSVKLVQTQPREFLGQQRIAFVMELEMAERAEESP